MTRMLAALCLALALVGCAPVAAQQHPVSVPAAHAMASTKNGDPFADLLASMLQPDPPPEVSCESLDGSDKCVPQYRLSDEINEQTAGRAIKWIEAANKAGANELLLELNTPGGSVPDGFDLARAIEDSEAPVTCVIDGDGDSMGFYILQSCDQRLMTKRSKLMAHEPALSGRMGGHPNEWQAIADMLKAEATAIAEHCSHRLKVTLKEYRARTDGSKMWWFDWNEAKKYGAIDDVAKSVKSLHKAMLSRPVIEKAE